MAGGVMRHRREAGFTLIEIILVLILIGLLAAIGAPRMSYLQAPDATTEYQKALMAARIAHARNQAILKEKTVKLQVTNGNSIEYQDMDTFANEGKIQSLEGVTLTDDRGNNTFEMSFNKDFTYTGATKKITITPTDKTSAAITLTISGVGYAQ